MDEDDYEEEGEEMEEEEEEEALAAATAAAAVPAPASDLCREDDRDDDDPTGGKQLDCIYVSAQGEVVQASVIDDAECPHRMHVCLSPSGVGSGGSSCDGAESPAGSSTFLITERPGDAADVDEQPQDAAQDVAAAASRSGGSSSSRSCGIDAFTGVDGQLRLLINVSETSAGISGDDCDDYEVVLRLSDGTFSSCTARGCSSGSSCGSRAGTPALAADRTGGQDLVGTEPEGDSCDLAFRCRTDDSDDAGTACADRLHRPAHQAPPVFVNWSAGVGGGDSDDGRTEGERWAALMGVCRQWAADECDVPGADEVMLCDALDPTEVFLSDEAGVTMLTTPPSLGGCTEAAAQDRRGEEEEEVVGWLM